MSNITGEKLISTTQLSAENQPPCSDPVIVPVITYRATPLSAEEVLDVRCKKTLCSLDCRFKNLVNFD